MRDRGEGGPARDALAAARWRARADNGGAPLSEAQEKVPVERIRRTLQSSCMSQLGPG